MRAVSPTSDPSPVVRVEDPDDPRLDPYRSQKDAWLRARRDNSTGLDAGLFLAEGELVVRALVDSPCPVVSLLTTPTRLRTIEDLLARLPRDAHVFVAPDALVERIVGFDLHRGVLALGRRVSAPKDLAARARVVLVAEDLSNHDNVGALFRNAAGLLGIPDIRREGPIPCAVLLSPRCCDPLYRKSLRVSMGYALRVPFERVEDWPGGLARLREDGFHVVALTPGEGAEPIGEHRTPPGKRLALLVGGEGAGLTPRALASADARVRIPMASGVDSLNVATAAALAVFALARPAG